MAWGSVGELAVVIGDLAVDDGEVDACGESGGLGVGGMVEDGSGLEDGDVGEIAGLEEAAIDEALTLGGQVRSDADVVNKRPSAKKLGIIYS